MKTGNEALDRLLRRSREGLESRRNRLEDYLPLVAGHLRGIAAGEMRDVPAPLCVQLQVSSTCSTHCRMCQHWMKERPELPTEDWLRIFEDLAKLGVRSGIFSGGEPLQREDIAVLLAGAASQGLRVGLLTSGSGILVDRSQKSRDEAIDAIANNVQWVAVSIDGTRDVDKEVRHPQRDGRYDALKYVCAKLKKKNGELSLSATLTLQKTNIGMDLQKAVRFIQDEIGIPQVNFKLATGARKALAKSPEYLLGAGDVKNLQNFLWQNHLPQEKGNNLAYLRRAFAADVFDADDVADGVPARSFYRANALRCFTPFLFSLIDCDGAVYPCCHLYRDNHGWDGSTQRFRREHQMGNVIQVRERPDGTTEREISFRKVWTGEPYADERQRLERINPDDGDFVPCGECTRHCQHNASLTRALEILRDDRQLLEQLERLGAGDAHPVWF